MTTIIVGELYKSKLSNVTAGSAFTNETEVKTTVNLNGNLEFKWIIKDFSLINNKKGPFSSPDFQTFTDKLTVNWNLWLYPLGATKDDTGYISIFLTCNSSRKENKAIEAECCIKLENPDFISANNNETSAFKLNSKFSKEQSSFGRRKFISKSEVQLIPPNNEIIISCVFKKVILKKVPNMIEDNEMLQKYKKVFNSEILSDVTFKVGDKKIFAHKIILLIESKVFSEMFKSNDQSEIEICDIDYDIFYQLIKYVYTGEVDIVTLELLEAADKYKIDGLKSLCEILISENLMNENVANILVSANDHQANILKKKAMDYILENAVALFKSPIKNNFKILSKDLLLEIISKLSSKLESDWETE